MSEAKKPEPIVLKGTIDYTITVYDDHYTLDAGKRSMQNDLCAILYAKDITEKIQVDFKLMKEDKNIKGSAKTHTKSRLDKLIHSSYSLTSIATDIIMTILARSQKRDS